MIQLLRFNSYDSTLIILVMRYDANSYYSTLIILVMRYDANSDGQISEDEMKRVLAVMCESEASARRVLASFTAVVPLQARRDVDAT